MKNVIDILKMQQVAKKIEKSWKKHGKSGTFLPLLISYNITKTSDKVETDPEKICVITLMNSFIYESIDAFMDAMPKETKKGIMNMDDDDFVLFPMAKHYIDRFFNQDGEQT